MDESFEIKEELQKEKLNRMGIEISKKDSEPKIVNGTSQFSYRIVFTDNSNSIVTTTDTQD